MASTAADRVSAKLKEFGKGTSESIEQGVEFAKRNPIMTGVSIYVFVLLVLIMVIVTMNSKADIEVKTKADQETVDNALTHSKNASKVLLFLVFAGAAGVAYLKTQGYTVSKL